MKPRCLHWNELSPNSLQEVQGHNDLVGPEGELTKILESGEPRSLILWGPPGCGKTTMADLYSQAFSCKSLRIRLEDSRNHGFSDCMKAIERFCVDKNEQKERVIFFVDEIHRLTRYNQKRLAAWLKNPCCILVAATICHPSKFLIHEMKDYDISYLQVNLLDDGALQNVLNNCENRYDHLQFTQEGREMIVGKSKGCGRRLLKMIELMNLRHREDGEKSYGMSGHFALSPEKVNELISINKREFCSFRKGALGKLKRSIVYSSSFYAVSYLAFLLEIGVDPREIFAFLIGIAVEEVGLADRDAFSYVQAAYRAWCSANEEKRYIPLCKVVVFLSESRKATQFNLDYINEGKRYIEEYIRCKENKVLKDNKRAFYHPLEKRYREKIRFEVTRFSKVRKQIQKEMKNENIVD